MCGESWLAIKDSLTHHPSSQGWASSVRLCYRLNAFVFLRQICMSKGEGGIFLSFLVSLIGWYNNFILVLHTCVYVCKLSSFLKHAFCIHTEAADSPFIQRLSPLNFKLLKVFCSTNTANALS